ncbi:MAG TPA: hypothetical protein VGL40_07820 [Bacillota bacterium]
MSRRSRAIRRLMSACIFSVPLCLGIVASISWSASSCSWGSTASFSRRSAAM